MQNNQITFTGNHHLVNGQRVTYRLGNGNAPVGGLTNGQSYYVIYVSPTAIKLTTTAGTGTGRGVAPLDSHTTAHLLPVAKPLSELLAADLNRLIAGPAIYAAERFAGVALRPVTTQLLAQYPEGHPVLNRLLLEDAYPTILPAIQIPSAKFPAAIYYAERSINRLGGETVTSTVENVQVHLSGNNNAFQVDSTFGGTTSVDGGTNTTVTLGSSVTGLHPATPQRVAFINGTVSISAARIVVDDSGNDQPTTGTLNVVTPPTWTNHRISSGSHLWTDAVNWNGGVAPNSSGATALFLDSHLAYSPNAVQLNGNKTVGTLLLNTATGGFTIGAPSSTDILTLNNGTSPASVNVANGTDTINAPLQLGSNATVSVGTGSRLTINGAISQSGDRILTKEGTGTLDLNGAELKFKTLAVNGGTVNVNGKLGGTTGGLAGTAAVSVSNAAGGAPSILNFGNVSQTLSSLTIGAGSTVTFGSGLASSSTGSGGVFTSSNTLEGERVTGLMPGTVTFTGTPTTTIKLGANNDTFYVPATAAGQSVRVETGPGYDTVYVGTVAGEEKTGTLNELKGSLFIDGGPILTGLNTLFLNDQGTTTPQSYTVTNDYVWTLTTNNSQTIDTTTITRGGVAIVQYSREETVALNGGSGGNTIDIQGTHREQSTDGSTSSTFTANSGSGSDIITLGAPVAAVGANDVLGAAAGAADGGHNLIRITVASTAKLYTGAQVSISGMTSGTTEANGTWTITVINSTTFDLQRSTFVHAYVANSGGKVFTFSMTGFQQDVVEPNFVTTAEGLPPSRRGVSVLINTQGGNDKVAIRDTASTTSTSLAFTQTKFRDLFPVDLDARVDSAEVFSAIFGESALGRPFTTVALAEMLVPTGAKRPVNISIRESSTQAVRIVGQQNVELTVSQGTVNHTATSLSPSSYSLALVNTAVLGATNNGSGQIRIRVAATFPIVNQDRVTIAGVTGTTEANGTWTIIRIDATHFDLQGSTFSRTYGSGGTVSSAQSDQIIFASNPNLIAGQAVVYHKGSGGSIGLEDGQVYYVILVNGNANAIQLALTAANNAAAVDLKVPTASPDTLSATALTNPVSFTPSSTTVANDRIIFASNTTLTAGQAVVYRKGSGNGSIGLDDGRTYYVKLVAGSPNAIQLALTADATAVAVTLNFSGQWLAPVGNVVQMTSAAYENDLVVHSGNGNDTFNVENGVRMTNGHTLVLNGGGGDDGTYVDFNGVSIIDRGNLGQTVKQVTFDRNDADSGLPGHTPLLPGAYFVETQWNGSQWQFRIVDSTGNPQAVADLNNLVKQVKSVGQGAVRNLHHLIRIELTSPASLINGDQVSIAGTNGADGIWTVTKIDATHFDLVGSTFTAASTPVGATLATFNLMANWQNISQLPIVGVPDGKATLVSRFDSHRGFVIDFSDQYRATGASIVGAVRLNLSTDSSGVVNNLSFAKHGILAQTITAVTFVSAEVNPGRALTGSHSYYVQTQWDGVAKVWQFRLWDSTADQAVAVATAGGSGFTSNWQNIGAVTAVSGGSREFHTGTGLVITFGPEYQSGTKSAGSAMELLLGVPQAKIAMTFNGGAQTADGVGDTLRIAGDGDATKDGAVFRKGGVYEPSSTLSGGGKVTVYGNEIAFSGVEPLIVHGFPHFEMRTPNLAAALVIDGTQLANVSRQQLQLHTLTVEGQVTWTQQKQFTLERPALDPRMVGRAIAVSDDGLTMVVGAKATAGGQTGNLTDGMVLVYQWNGSLWVETARLEPNDLRLGLNFGIDFGASVAIDGNRLVVGAPGDTPANAPSASFNPNSLDAGANWIVFASNPGLLVGQAVLYSKGFGNSSINLIDGSVYFVQAVSGNKVKLAATIGGAVIDLTAPSGTNPSSDKLTRANYGAAYVFERSSLNGVWIQKQKLLASDPAADRYFGASVAIRGNEILVGAPGPAGYNDSTENGKEAAYFFPLVGNNWNAPVRQSQPGDFGRSVALAGNFGVSHFGQSSTAGDFAVIGAPAVDGVFVYAVGASSVTPWGPTLRASDYLSTNPSEQFGAAVAATSQPRTDTVNGVATQVQINRIVVGAPLWNGPATYGDATAHAEQGRAFVFDLVSGKWTVMARLTADGGLSQADAKTEARTGDHFGAAVALDNQYVVVGAPNHGNGISANTGSAYVFYELQNGTTDSTGTTANKGSSWTRSTGAVLTSTGTPGSGRLERASGAAGNDYFGAAVAVWHDPVTGIGRTMLGVPGSDETIGTSRTDLGAVLTFTTTGTLPSTTLANLYAETLSLTNPTSMTLYDAKSRTLFVADKVAGRIYTYLNEGLYWRPSTTLTGWVAGKGAGFGIDMDLDALYGRLVVGTTANYVYIFQRQADGTWGNHTAPVPGTAISGTILGGSFGSSVAIDGSKLVVGAPTATVKYQKTPNSPSTISTYWLDLGLGSATTTAGSQAALPTGTSTTVGAAHLYNFSNGTSWAYDRLLMPDDFNLPSTTSNFVAAVPTSTLSGESSLRRYDNGGWMGWKTVGDRDLDDYAWTGTTDTASDDSVALRIGPRTHVELISDDGDDKDVNFFNSSYTQFAIITFDNGAYLTLSSDGVNQDGAQIQGPYTAMGDHHRNEVDYVNSWLDAQTSKPEVKTYYTFSMAGAQWGSSVDIVGSSVTVGAAGRSKTAVYDLNQSDYSSWNVQVVGLAETVRIARATQISGSVSFGTDVTLLAGNPHLFSQAGSRVLIGTPTTSSGVGAAALYNSTGTSLGVSFAPYKFQSSNSSMVLENAAVGFGTAPSIISDGFYVVGNNSSILSTLYDFRQRGPGWTTDPGLVSTPAALNRAQLGSSVAIVGTTAVFGAPEYGKRGAVFIYTQVPSGDPSNPQWALQAQIEAPGFQTDDQFGASVALHGDYLIVGAPGRDASLTTKDVGAAYLYHRVDGQWTLEMESVGTVAGALRGSSVDINGSYAVAGAPGSGVIVPSVSLFRKVGGVWSADTTPISGAVGSGFGTAVHLDSTNLFVGAPGSASTPGAVSIYGLDFEPKNVASNVKSGLSPQVLLPFSGGVNGDQFGKSLDGSGKYLVVGAPGKATDPGAAYVFTRPTATTGWVQARLDFTAGAVAGDQFGWAVAIDGVQIIVGAPGRVQTTSSGLVYTRGEAFSYGLRNSGVWTLETPADLPLNDRTLATASTAPGTEGDNVGYSVAISGDLALLGAPQLIGRPSANGVIEPDGGGNVFLRSINPPGNKILPEVQAVLVAGAQTNTIAGTVDGTLNATLQFFDIPNFFLHTSLANGIRSTLEMKAVGFSAFGLAKFTAEGNLTYTNRAPVLKMPTDGLFEYTASVQDRGTTPIALDLNGNGRLDFVGKTTGVTFDLNGIGVRLPTAWLAPGDGWLFIDLGEAGVQVTRNELSFVAQVPTASSDLDALRNVYFNSDRNGVLDAADSQWLNLRIWQDLNQDGITTANEVQTLSVAGITSISLASDDISYRAVSGEVTVLGQSSFVRNGSTGIVGDVVLNTDVQAVVPGTQLQVIEGVYDFNGGSGSTYVADADTDWTLYYDRVKNLGILTASDGREAVSLKGFTNIQLRGGASNNRIEVVSWIAGGNVTIDGGGGKDTIILHADSGAGIITVLDTGADDDLAISGTDQRDLIQITPHAVNVTDGAGAALLQVDYNLGVTAMAGVLRISGGAGDDDITVDGTSSSLLELDGGTGSDLYSLVSGNQNTKTHVSDTGADNGSKDATVDNRTGDILKVFVSGPSVTGYANLKATDVIYNTPFSAVLKSTASRTNPLLFDNSIEKLDVQTVDPHLIIEGNGTFIVSNDAVYYNGATYSLAGRTDLTIITEGNDSTIQVDQIPSFLATFTINARAGAGDTLIGPDQTSAWSISGAGIVSIAGPLTTILDFSGIENLTGRSGADTFTFTNGGSISGVIDGGDGTDVVDYSARTAGVTVNLNTAYLNMETLRGSQGEDTLIAPNTDNTWSITGPKSGTLGGLDYSLIEHLVGGTNADEFLLSTASLVGGVADINGGDGENRIEFTGTAGNDLVVVGVPAVTFNGNPIATYVNIGRIDVITLGGLDEITVNPAVSGFPDTVNVWSGADNDQILVNLVAGAATEINIDGGAQSTGDTVTLTGTASADIIGVDGLVVEFGGITVNLEDIENLTVAGGLGDDQLSLTGTPFSGVVSLLGGGDNDTITLHNPAGNAHMVVDGGTGTTDALVVNLSDEAETVGLTATEILAAGNFHVDYTNFDSLDLFTLGGGDVVTITQTHAGTTQVDTGDDGDTVNVLATAGVTTINTGGGEDIVNIRAIGAAVTVNGGDDSDTVNVGSLAPVGNGVLTGIAALLTIHGDGDDDSLNVDATGDLAANSGALNTTRLTGLGMTSGIVYEGLENLHISLGHFGDTFTINSTEDGVAVTLNSGGGDDLINVGANNGPTTIHSGDGSDTINVIPSANGPVDPAVVTAINGSAINGLLTVDGGGATGDQDVMNFTLNFPSVQPGYLTDTQITGLQMPLGITYSNLETLNVRLGPNGLAGNTFFINEINPLTHTTVDGGTSANDSVFATFAVDFNGRLDLTSFEHGTLEVGRNFNGTLTNAGPGHFESVVIGPTGYSLTNTGVLNAGSIDMMSVGFDLAGHVTVTGNLGALTVGSTAQPGNLRGTVLVHGTLTTLNVTGDVSGTVTESGTINLLTIGGSLTATGVITAFNPADPAEAPGATFGNINTLTIGSDLAGRVTVTGNVGTLAVGSDLTGTVSVQNTLSVLRVTADFSGSVTESGTMNLLTIGGSLTATGVINVKNTKDSLQVAAGVQVALANINTMTVGRNLSGAVTVTGNLGTVSNNLGGLTVGRSTVDSITASGRVTVNQTLTNLTVKGDVAGRVTASGRMTSVTIGGSLTATGEINAVNTTDPVRVPGATLANINAFTITRDLVGKVRVTGNLVSLLVSGNLSGQASVQHTLTTLRVTGDVSGTVTESGTINVLWIGGSLTTSGAITASNTADPTEVPTPSRSSLANINTATIARNLTGTLLVSGNLTRLSVGSSSLDALRGTVTVNNTLTTLTVTGDVSGTVRASGTMNLVSIGGSLTATGSIIASNTADPAQVPSPGFATLGNINTMTITRNLAGTVLVTGNLTTLSVGSGALDGLRGTVTVHNTLSNLTVTGDFSGTVTESGTIAWVWIEGLITGTLSAVNTQASLGNIDTLNLVVFQDLAGRVIVSGAINTVNFSP